MSKKVICLLFGVFMFLSASTASAVTVNVDTGAYQGKWAELPGGTWKTGSATIDLSVGTRRISVAHYGYFDVNVASDGTVTVNNGVSATGGLNTLTFNTTPVTINPGAYLYVWSLQNVSGKITGAAATFDLVPGVNYVIWTNHVENFYFNPAADGTVTVNNGVSATGGPNTLTFNTIPVTINLGSFSWQWSIPYVTGWIKSGGATLDLIPGIRSMIGIGNRGRFYWNMTADGTITIENGVSATGGDKTITFNTVPVSIDPVNYQGPWAPWYVTGANYGPVTHALVPGVGYRMWIDYGFCDWDLAADGSVTVDPDDTDSLTWDTGSRILKFNNAVVTIDPANFSGTYAVRPSPGNYGQRNSGVITVTLVPGLRHSCGFGTDLFYWDLATDGTVTVDPADTDSATGGAGTLTFNNAQVTINPCDYLGGWGLREYGITSAHGPDTFTLVPGLKYGIRFGGSYLYWELAGDGMVTVPNGISAIGGLNTLHFNTSPVYINPIDYAGQWNVRYMGDISGNSPVYITGAATHNLVPGVTYQIVIIDPAYKASNYFDLDEPCEVIPDTTTINFTGGSATFELSCPSTGPSNNPPVAVAGTDQNLFLGETAYLDGSGSSDPDGDPITYSWTIASAPALSVASIINPLTAAPDFTPDVIGDYTLSLVVTDDCALVSVADTVMISASHNLPPNAVATADLLTGDVPLTVCFDALGSSDPDSTSLTFAWDFGDPDSGANNTSTFGQDCHTYNSVGIYTAVVTVADEFDNSDQAVVVLEVTAPNMPPTVSPTATPDDLSVYFTANANDPEGDPLTYEWDFGDGSPVSTGADPTHVYSSPGTYTATVIVSDGEQFVTGTVVVGVVSSLNIDVYEAKVEFGNAGKAKGKMHLKSCFSFPDMPEESDHIVVGFQSIILVDVPFSSFEEEDNEPGEFTCNEKKLHAKIDFNNGTIKVHRHNMVLAGLDDSGFGSSVNVVISFGMSTNTDHFAMKNNGGNERKWSYKKKHPGCVDDGS